MPRNRRKVAALAVGTLALLAAASLPSTGAQGPAGRTEPNTWTADKATIDWVERSEIAPLIDGIVQKMEVEIGRTVPEGGTIGILYKKKAELTVKKAELAAGSVASIKKAEAQQALAYSVVARNERLLRQGNLVSREDQEKAEAEVLVSNALILEAKDNQALAKAELALAQNQLEEHTITAPFAGVVIKRIKNPGESVRANEAVIELGNLDKLRAYVYIPLDVALRVSEGALVELQPSIGPSRSGTAPIEQKKFRGVVTFVDPQVQAVGETGVRIYADFKNDTHELRPGLKGAMTIHLNPPGSTVNAGRDSRVAPAATASSPGRSDTANGVELPTLPR